MSTVLSNATASSGSTRFDSLRRLLPPGAKNFLCESEASDLQTLTAELARRVGGAAVAERDVADAIITDCLPHPAVTGAGKHAALLVFGAGYSLAADEAPLKEYAGPAWLIEEAAGLECDLFAICAKGSGAYFPLTSWQILDSRERRQPAGLFGEIAIEPQTAAAPLKRSGAWGKSLQSGRVLLARFNTAGIRIDGKWIDSLDLAMRLRAIRGVRELVVMCRRTKQLAPELVVYWSSTDDEVRASAERALSAQANSPARLSLVHLPQLYFDAQGALDWPRLAALPVIDESECRAARARALELGASDASADRVLEIPPLPPVPAYVRERRYSDHVEQTLNVPEQAPVASAGVSELDGPELIFPPQYPQTLPALLERAATQHPEHTICCVDGLEEDTVTYGELAARARAGAGALATLGLKKGDRIVLQTDAIAPFLQWFWAAQYAGLTVAVVGRTGNGCRDAELLTDVCDRVQARHVISDGSLHSIPLASAVSSNNSVCSRSEPDDLALILSTSGSSAKPKLVPQTHAALLAQGYASAIAIALSSSDVSMNWMPLEHVGGLVMFHLRDLHAGCRQLQVSRARILTDPLQWLELIERHRVSVSWSPHFGYALLAGALERSQPRRCALDCVRILINGGEAVVSESARRCASALTQLGVPRDAMRPAWGMSETCSLATISSTGNLLPDPRSGAVSVGWPIAGTHLRIVDETRTPVPRGRSGKLEIRGPCVFAGYLHDLPRADPWFDTGDRACIDDDGLRIVGRAKEVIIVNGQNFSCLHLERLLDSISEIDPAHLCAVAHRQAADDTERPAIFVVPRPNVEASHAARAARDRIRAHLGLDALVIPVQSDRIPRNAIGKPKRSELQRLLATGAFDSAIDSSEGRSGSVKPLPSWFFRQSWVTRQRQGAQQGSLHKWMVFSDDSGHARELVQALGAEGLRAEAFTEHGDSFASCEALVIALRPDPAAAPRCDVRLQVLLRRLIESKHSSFALVLSEQALGDDARISPQQAGLVGAMLGLWHAFAREHPRQRLRWLDMPSGWSARQRMTHAILESQAADDALVVCLRDRGRRIARLQPAHFRPSSSTVLRAGGRYLVTGALGDLGQILCRHLLTAWSATVIGVTRAAHAPEAAERHQSRAASLCAAGHFDWLTADVAEPLIPALQAQAHRIGTIDGVFHLAGAFRLSTLRELESADYRALTLAKLDGTLNALDTLRQFGTQGAFFAAYGSSNVEVGGAGAAAYTAASVAQQLICEAACREGTPAYYLGWSQWPDLGLTRKNSLTPLAVRHGLCDIGAEDGIRALERALAGPPGTLLIGLDATRETIAGRTVTQHFEPRLRLQIYTRDASQALGAGALGVDRFGNAYSVMLDLSIPETPQSMQYRRMEALLVEVWREVLGNTELDVRRNFFELGGNSLRLLQAKGRLEQTLGRPLDIALLFRHSSIQQLATYLTRPEEGSAESQDASARGVARRQARSQRPA